jgi:hypothetical protein
MYLHVRAGRYNSHKAQHITGWITDLTTVYQLLWLFSTKWYEWMTLYGELETAWKEVVGVYFTAQSQHLSGGIEEEYEKCSKVGVLSRFK